MALLFALQVSVSCGIPDFRSRDGIYARLAVDFPDLPDPQSMFDIEYFRRDPRPFFKFAKVRPYVLWLPQLWLLSVEFADLSVISGHNDMHDDTWSCMLILLHYRVYLSYRAYR